MRRRAGQIGTAAVLLAALVAAGCSGGEEKAARNLQAVRVTGGVDEKNFEQALKAEKAIDELTRVHDAVEEPASQPPEELPSR